MIVTFIRLLNFVNWTDPATETKSIGLAADTRVVMVFASLSGQFYHDRTTRGHLSGLSHLDNFIVTRNFSPSAGTLQKHMPTLTRTATQLNRRAVMVNILYSCHLANIHDN